MNKIQKPARAGFCFLKFCGERERCDFQGTFEKVPYDPQNFLYLKIIYEKFKSLREQAFAFESFAGVGALFQKHPENKTYYQIQTINGY